ncbi:hypothetical protein N7452_004444 [Penicillium brevicompactum]|uniref:Uncharacterized protein n=1 Tax=Penicillium brevicompactum TaxID=5074 RepID=A0A9W9UGG3_PENBR|nr:hypothetical protein N7452_004444 [Penicillium brevicompactum]
MANKMSPSSTVCPKDPMTATLLVGQTPQKITTSQSTAVEVLLHRCHFNWADEVEDSIAKADVATGVYPITDMSTPDIRCYFPRMAKPTEAVWPQPYTPRASRFQPSLPTLEEESDEDLDEQENPKSISWSLPVEDFGHPLRRVHSNSQDYARRRGAISPRFNRPLSTIFEEDEDEDEDENDHTGSYQHTTSEDEEASHSSDDEPFPDEETDTESVVSGDDEYDAAVQQCFDDIYDDRYGRIAANNSIHHFSWAGYPVTHRSTTSPSDSLALIMSDPKVPRGSNKYRGQAMLNNAFPLVDPVIVFMDGIDDSMFELRGSKLAKASAGRAYKFYSPHGLWLDDSNEHSDVRYDSGCLDTYESGKAVVGNGFYGEGAIRPISQWIGKRQEIFEASDKSHSLPRKSTWKPKPSPLSQCETLTPVKLPSQKNALLESPFPIQCDALRPTVMPRQTSWRIEASYVNRCDMITPIEPQYTTDWPTRPPPLAQHNTAGPAKPRGSKAMQPISSSSLQRESESVVENPQKRLTKPQKKARKSRTTIPRSQATTACNDTHHEYFSFPTPVFRRSRMRQVGKAVMTVLRKGVVYLHNIAKKPGVARGAY